ncbi:MAG: outer membrane beta-barrel protein, partial [Candidatus Omnitrophica bacterium]|nr:outer membrane beta-barrel protein [Candidatus Omnitrophota bacterium]
MKRSIGLWLAMAGLLCAGAPAWADDGDTAALKADIEVLKNRLAQLESQVGSSTFTGATGIGEKAVPTLVELPSGLQGLALSGYADVSYIYNFAEPSPNSNTGGSLRNNRTRVFDTEPNGFTPHAFELVVEKAETDEMPLGFRADLFYGDDASVFKSTGLGAAGEDLDLQQAYITATAPIGEG